MVNWAVGADQEETTTKRATDPSVFEPSVFEPSVIEPTVIEPTVIDLSVLRWMFAGKRTVDSGLYLGNSLIRSRGSVAEVEMRPEAVALKVGGKRQSTVS